MVFETHPYLPDIEDGDTVLWRYVDLYRYMDFLQSSELHLTRGDQMEDRWEGSYSTVNVSMRPTMYGENWETRSAYTDTIYLLGRTHVYLNCWYVGIHESYAMWRLYDVTGKGVAIRTTARRLKAALIGEHLLHGAQVQYVDYATTFIPEGNMFFPYIHKRLSFSHENEYRLLGGWSQQALEVDEQDRAVRQEPDIQPLFLREAVNVPELVEAVYVSPDAPDWVARVVAMATDKYVPGIEVRHSDLAADPVY